MAHHGRGAAAGTGRGSSMEIVPYSGELDLELPPVDVKRQDSLYRDATLPAHAGHHGQESWLRTLRLAFQCVGILYADLGTSPLYVYANTFKKGVGHEDDVLGVLSIIIYSFILFTMIKIVFIALYANDEGDGGTFALYSLISRYAKVLLIPNQQAEDELVSRYRHHPKQSATLRRAQWMKNLLETSKAAKISLFFLTILATALAISDCMLTPPISVLAAVNGLKLRAPHLTTGTEALFADLGYFSIRSIQFELENTVSRDEVKDLLERQDLKRVPGLGLFYTELVQGIPPIFPHLIEKIPTIHSVIVFITVKHLPIPHVDVSDRFLFRQVEPKELMVFRCVARYGYRDTLEMASDFVKVLVEYLQYYVRDLNLYGGYEKEPLKIIFHSARVDSFSWDRKPSGHSIYAEEMLTPAQSFSELTMHPVSMSSRLAHFKTEKMNLEEMLKIEEDQKLIQREVDNGVVYIVGESEVVAKPHSNLLKKIIVNYIYSFLRKNSRNGEKMLSIPRGQLLKVGITYEI
nr:unnamed protein product [Digitaria exilis]